jgi:hypothetical protein
MQGSVSDMKPPSYVRLTLCALRLWTVEDGMLIVGDVDDGKATGKLLKDSRSNDHPYM